MTQNRTGSWQKFGGMHRGQGKEDWMMFGPMMGDFGGKWASIWSWMGLLLNQQKQAMQTAIQNNDYAAYVKAYETAKLTQDQFSAIVKMNQAKSSIDAAITKGDFVAYTAAVKGTSMENKVTETQFKDMVAKHTQRTALRDAVTANDYTAFVAAVKGTPMEGKVSKEAFATMVQREKNMGQQVTK